MGLNLQIVALTLPEGSEFPPTPQALMNSNAQYLTIAGEEDFSGINYGSTEPAAENRDRPWFKLDDQGNPVGWFSWTGSAWTEIPTVIASGATSDRPVNAIAGQIFRDTDIGVVLIYTRSTWITLSGSPGDCKFVKTSTLQEALDTNPGWSWDDEMEGFVLAGASDGTSAYEYGTQAGDDEVTLVIANLPSDTVPLKDGWGISSGAWQNGPQGPGIFPIATGLSPTQTTGPINGGVTQEPVDVRQKTLYRWALVKDA